MKKAMWKRLISLIHSSRRNNPKSMRAIVQRGLEVFFINQRDNGLNYLQLQDQEDINKLRLHHQRKIGVLKPSLITSPDKKSHREFKKLKIKIRIVSIVLVQVNIMLSNGKIKMQVGNLHLKLRS
eukprot:GHVR01053777.1.p1 GENE.GHVR01053777.1~~GHVR01053777.1.p1  ORF type:complete len:125 (-),score=5.01 GHVR01053777.1:769-1143(-)